MSAKFGAGHAFAKESDADIIQHVFDSQFSTKETVTDISGRGVGLDAVKTEAESLGGKAWVSSKVGSGSTLTVEVPWLTARADAAKSASLDEDLQNKKSA
jgi:two-component system chemotaxis sensor kinase CheA